ncbi:MAG TPA: hypothetical protein VJ180_04890 [Pyrinomonadaceae bacterium]|nr:hypothetical protein [Pyrinomonadaceae bacterium]
MNIVLKIAGVVCLATVWVCAGCQRVDTNANANLSLANANTSPIANANVSAEPISSIAAREPERYQATLIFSAETEGGQKTIGIPTLSAQVARNGADRRVAFKLPDGSDLVYLEKGDLHIVIAPARKQYAELTPEATGLQLQKLMTPGQLVARLEKLRGIERVGEESLNGRTAEKYRYATTSNTNTQAGTVNTEAFVYVDKETGLPLRSELFTEASGEVQGVKGARIVAEMRDINTNVDSSMFEVPTGYSKVPPEQVRQQINALANTATALVRALFGGMVSQSGATPAVSPATSPTP